MRFHKYIQKKIPAKAGIFLKRKFDLVLHKMFARNHGTDLIYNRDGINAFGKRAYVERSGSCIALKIEAHGTHGSTHNIIHSDIRSAFQVGRQLNIDQL